MSAHEPSDSAANTADDDEDGEVSEEKEAVTLTLPVDDNVRNEDEEDEDEYNNRDDPDANTTTNSSNTSSSSSAVQVITRFMCKFCGLQFVRRADMDAHASLHEEEKPPLTCGVCGKVYNTRSKLQRHVRVHSGERPFPCVVCGKRFPRSDHVKQHMRVHAKVPGGSSEAGSGSPPPPPPLGLTHKSYCRLCGVKFEQRSELSAHLLTHGFNKLFSCIHCGEVFESNDKLKAHKVSHQSPAAEEYLVPVLTVPDWSLATKCAPPFPPSSSSSLSKTPGVKRKRPGRPRSSGAAGAKRRKEMSRLGFSKFKIARRAGSESWQAISPVLKNEEAAAPSLSRSLSRSHDDKVGDKSTPILERILKESQNGRVGVVSSSPPPPPPLPLPTVVKEEEEEEETIEEEDNESDDNDSGEGKDNSDSCAQMSISACYSLAEGQDNSDIPDIEEIRASTFSDGSNMIVVPMTTEEEEEEGRDNNPGGAAIPSRCRFPEGEAVVGVSSQGATVCAVTGSRSNEGEGGGEMSRGMLQTSFIRPTIIPATATATAALMTLQQQVYPQTSSSFTTSSSSSSSTPLAPRPTISLLPNVLAFRTHPLLTTPTHPLLTTPTHPLLTTPTHPLLTTPTLSLTPAAAVAAAAAAAAGGGLHYNSTNTTTTNNLHNSNTTTTNLHYNNTSSSINHLYNNNNNSVVGSFSSSSSLAAASSPALQQHHFPGATEGFPLGRKMTRCHFCCIWFEDRALGLLHQSLHSADETDPFTCKKCLKRLGNRLEFTAHIIWHLDPTMEDSAAV